MINLEMLKQTSDRLYRKAEQNQETAEMTLQMFRDRYELPTEEGEKRQIIEAGEEFHLVIRIPAADLPEGAILIPRIDVAERTRLAQLAASEEE